MFLLIHLLNFLINLLIYHLALLELRSRSPLIILLSWSKTSEPIIFLLLLLFPRFPVRASTRTQYAYAVRSTRTQYAYPVRVLSTRTQYAYAVRVRSTRTRAQYAYLQLFNFLIKFPYLTSLFNFLINFLI